MKKVKYIKITLKLQMHELYGVFSKFPYNNETGLGVEVFTYDKGHLDAKFTERLVFKEHIVDPYGNSEEIETIRFLSFGFCVFSLGKDVCLLSVNSPPRSLKSFVRFLSEIAGRGFSISNIGIDVSDFFRALSERDEFKVENIDQIKIKDVFISKSSRADVSVFSSQDAYSDAKEFLNNKKFSIGKVRMRIRSEQSRGQLEISSTGLLGASDCILQDIQDFSVKYFSDKVL